MTDLENKDIQMDTSDEEIRPESKETKEKGECEEIKKDTTKESNRKEPDSPKEKKTKNQNTVEESSKSNVSDSTSEREQDVLVKDNTIDQKHFTEKCEGDTKTPNQSEDINVNKTETNTDETTNKLEVSKNDKDEVAKINRKASDSSVIKGKLDVLLKKHDDELVKRHSSESEDENKDKQDQKENDGSKEKVNKSKSGHLLKPLKGPAKHTGILQKKKSNPFWSWKRYRFVLEGKLLSFYDPGQQDEDQQLKSLEGTIDLTTVLSVKSKKPGLLKNNFPFTLARKSQGPIILATDTTEERETWIEKITEELQRSNYNSSEPELNKSGGTEENARKSATLPTQCRTSGSLPTINIQDEDTKDSGKISENSKEEEDPEKKSDTEEEKPVLIVPKKVRGIGVMNFVPVGAVKLKNVSTSKKQEKEEKGTDSSSSDKQENLEKDKELTIDKSQEKILITTKTKVKNESNTDPIVSEQKDSEGIFGIKLKKTERNLGTENDKTRLNRKRSTSPNIPLSKNLQSVVSKNKDDEDSENIMNQEKKLDKENLNEKDSSKESHMKKEKEFIKTTEESVKNMTDLENNQIPSNNPSSDVTIEPRIIEVFVKKIDNQTNENQNISENNEIPTSNSSSNATEELQTFDDDERKTLREEKDSKSVGEEGDQDLQNANISVIEIAEAEGLSVKSPIDSTEYSDKESFYEECNKNIPINSAEKNLKDNANKDDNELEVNSAYNIKTEEQSKPSDKELDNDISVDIGKKVTEEINIESKEANKAEKLKEVETGSPSSTIERKESQKGKKSITENEISLDIDKKAIKEINIESKDVNETEKLKEVETGSPSSTIERKESLKEKKSISKNEVSVDIDKKVTKEINIKSKDVKVTDNLREVETVSPSSTIESKESLKGKKSISENEKKSSSGKFNFFKRKNSNSYDLQAKSDKQKSLDNTDLSSDVTSHDKKRRPSAFSKLLQGISRGSKGNVFDEPVVNIKSNDNNTTGKEFPVIEFNTEKDEDEPNKPIETSLETQEKSKNIIINEPIGEEDTDVETEVEESLVVRRDFHIPYDESRYSSYSRTSNKSSENVPPPSVPEKKGVRESSPVHDVPTSNQPISNINEVIRANNTEDDNVNKIDGYLSQEQIESVVFAKIERKSSLVGNSNNLLLPQPNSQSNGENEQKKYSFVSVSSIESDEPLQGTKFLDSERSRSTSESSEKRKTSLSNVNNNNLLQPLNNTTNNGGNSERKCHSFISVTSIESDDPLPQTKFLGSDRSSSESGDRLTDPESRHSKDLDSQSSFEAGDPDLKPPILRPSRPSSIISSNRKSLTQPEFIVMEEGPLTPGGTNEVDTVKFELPSIATKPEKSKTDCNSEDEHEDDFKSAIPMNVNRLSTSESEHSSTDGNSEDEHEDYFPVVGGGAVELRKSPNGSDKLLKEKDTGGNMRTSGIIGLKAYLNNMDEGASVPDSRIGINRLGQSIAVEKLKDELK